MGCQINGGSGVAVSTDGKYAGGFVGAGDGLYLTDSSAANLQKLSFWRAGDDSSVLAYPEKRPNSIVNLLSIHADEYAGGVAGSLRTASIAGLLNNAAGVGSFLPFTVQNTTVSGLPAGYTVAAVSRYAGGGFGELVGGSVGCSFTDEESGKTPVPKTGVHLTNLDSVTAKNVAAGFAAVSGPGELAGTGGIGLDLLGFKVLKVNNLLSLGQGVEVSLTDCTVQGISDGYTVSATGAPNDKADITEYLASGFIARSNSTKAEDCHALNLKSVTANVDAANVDAEIGKNGYAGGFLATSRVGGLVDTNDPSDSKGVLKGFLGDDGLLQVGELLGAINYLIPDYTNCTVQYTDAEEDAANVQADVAGGFAADFQSGTVNNDSTVDANGQDSPFAVYNISKVEGGTYAGGFAGKLYSGALADAGGGVSILGSIGISSVTDLLRVAQAYVPVAEYAGVQSSAQGLMVTACEISGEIGDLNAGSAGGFAGYASGAQISTCDVKSLRHTKVNEPTASSADGQDLVTDGADYYQVPGAVNGGRYAGGFIGKIDLGSAASVGGGLDLLGENVSLNNLLEALNVVVTTIEHSDVYGGPGGYVVLATAQDNGGYYVGHAGGFAGVLYGGHIQDSNAHNFSHILGRKTAGGYVGEMRPGDVASVLDKGTILQKLIKVDNLLSGLQVFVPTIRNSSTDSVPCGGVVWAEVTGDQAKQDGMAGGYVGHNEGGQIRGMDTEPWRNATEPYTGPLSLCKAERIRTVFGSLYAGGYTGFMEAADTAETGNLELLGGLITANNLLNVLKIVFPIHKNTAVYGPLANLDVSTWNSWVEYVGQYGGYGLELAQAGTVADQAELNQKLSSYIYGYDVYTANNDTAKQALASAGGYAGLMRSGTLTNCMAYDVKQVQAPGAAGGYAGRMETGGAASFGTVNILGFNLPIEDLISVVDVFVPAVKNSSVQGYASGMTVAATGTPDPDKDTDVGYAGGYVGVSYGAQIQLDGNDRPTAEEASAWVVSPDSTDTGSRRYPAPVASCDVSNLRRVTGRSSIGGYVGLATSAVLASVNTNVSGGLLQGVLNSVIRNVDNLLEVLPATVTTIHQASVSPADPTWGFVVDGAYGESYAPYAGGFAGQLQAAFLGTDQGAPGGADEGESLQNLSVIGLRQVDGGLYAGGFVGLGDVRAVAEVGGNESGQQTTTILDALLGGLAGLDNIDAADFLRTYIYHADVVGVADGYNVQAHTIPGNAEGTLGEIRWPGCAGGFAGAVLNGTVLDSSAANVSSVLAPNYTGGFIGHMGKSGLVDVDKVDLLKKLLDTTVGVVDLFGTQVQDCTATGIAQSADTGIEVVAKGGQQPIAGGFAGYADLGRIDRCHVGTQQPEDGQSWNLNGGLKLVQSSQVAGGFIGQTDMAYLVSAEVNSTLVRELLAVLGTILETLYVGEDGLESLKLVNAYLGIIKLEVLGDGNLLKLELLGIPITVSINKELQPGEKGVAVVTIGDSEVSLSYQYTKDKDGKVHVTFDKDSSDITINLIKGNRTELDNCTVTGVADGYDVFGGGAGQSDDQHAVCKDKTGSAGGFVGYNHEGKITNSKMYYCDVVKGTAGFVGPFTGCNDLRSVYFFNNMTSLEGQGNQYSIYRVNDPSLQQIQTADQKTIPVEYAQDTATGTTYDRYIVDHIVDFQNIVDPNTSGDDTNKGAAVQDTFKALDGAVMTGGDAENRNLDAYQADGGKAVLMLDTPTESNPGTMVPEPGVMGDPCSEKVDLTIQKIWDDLFNFWHTRWDSITLYLIQHKYQLNPQTNQYEEVITDVFPKIIDDITLTKADHQESPWSAVWRTVVHDQTVSSFDDTDHDGVWDEGEDRTYYVYTVEEQKVPDGYTVSYTPYDPDHAGDYVLTVTNKLNIPLPDTGGVGDSLFVVVGVGILLLAVTMRKRRRSGKGDG